MAIQRYQELKVWQEAIELTIETYDACDRIPSVERFGLTSQLTRAAISIPSNIAEGQGRSRAEFRRFLTISRGSLQELETLLVLAERRRYVDTEKLALLRARARAVGRLLNGFIRALSKD